MEKSEVNEVKNLVVGKTYYIYAKSSLFGDEPAFIYEGTLEKIVDDVPSIEGWGSIPSNSILKISDKAPVAGTKPMIISNPGIGSTSVAANTGTIASGTGSRAAGTGGTRRRKSHKGKSRRRRHV